MSDDIAPFNGSEAMIRFNAKDFKAQHSRIRIIGKSSDPRIDEEVKEVLCGLECETYLTGKQLLDAIDDPVLHKICTEGAVATPWQVVFDLLFDVNRADLALKFGLAVDPQNELDINAPKKRSIYIFEEGTFKYVTPL